MNDLNRLIQRLCDSDIEFVIVGGFAAMLYGSSQVTRDLDVCALLTAENVEKPRDTFRTLHSFHRLTSQSLSFLDNPDAGVAVRSGNAVRSVDVGSSSVREAICGWKNRGACAATISMPVIVDDLQVVAWIRARRSAELHDACLRTPHLGRPESMAADQR